MGISTELYGLIGHPVKHSLSSIMHNAAFKHLGIDAQYRLFDVLPQDLKDFLLNPAKIVKDTEGNSLSAKDIVGFNITIPHKIKAKKILEEAFPYDKNSSFMQEDLYYVKLSGAINTVKREGSLMYYWNTDAIGFLKSLKEDLKFGTKGKNVFIIGCGGAGRAIIAALSWKNMGINKIYIYDISEDALNSTKEHLLSLPKEWGGVLDKKIEYISRKDIAKEISDCQLLVNASSAGMKEGDNSPIDKNLLHKGLFVYDVVYNRNTELIKDAQSKGLRAKGGLSMLLYQGVAAFEFWTKKSAPVRIMRKALEEKIC